MASDERRSTDSGIEIRPLYTEADLAGWDPAEQLGDPGEAPYTRGIYPSMYRGRLWTMRQYAGFGSAEEMGVDPARIGGTVQQDLLKERTAAGT